MDKTVKGAWIVHHTNKLQNVSRQSDFDNVFAAGKCGERSARHAESAQKVAEYLEAHPKVARVAYPGLASHPQHDIAKAQMSGFSGMISFELTGGLDAGRTVMNEVKLCGLHRVRRLAQTRSCRGIPRSPSEGRPGRLPGPRLAPSAPYRQGPDVGLQRHDLV